MADMDRLKHALPMQEVYGNGASEELHPPNAEIASRSDDDHFWSTLSADLHDGVTQQIWYLNTELDALAHNLKGERSDLQDAVMRLKTVAEDAYAELRGVLDTLSQHRNEQVDLVAELAEVAEKFSGLVEMNVEFRTAGKPKRLYVNGNIVKHVRRLVQEALWNSWRHSMCDSAIVSMSHEVVGLIITISDNGRGFSPDIVDDRSYGLRNMRERAESIQGRLYLTSRIGGGTSVVLHIPKEAFEGQV